MSRWKPPRCSSGKAAFRSQGKALAALESIRITDAQAVAHGPGVRGAYRCPECRAWHLTKKRGQVAA